MFIRNFLISCILSLSISFSLSGQVVLKVYISELKNNDGIVLLELRDGNEKFVKGLSQEIQKNSCVFVIRDLKPGKYSFKFFHDENKNKELDTNWLGIPKEGIGFSNNAKATFGPPSFDETVFEIKGNTVKKCLPHYYSF